MIVRGLLTLSCVVFAVTGAAYVAIPGAALGIVGIVSSPTSEFLLRTEGVPLLFGAALLWAVRDGGHRVERVALLALAGYYVLSSVIDLAAYAGGIVGPAAIPSAGGRNCGRRGLRRSGVAHRSLVSACGRHLTNGPCAPA